MANLSVYENVLLIEEQSSRRSTTRREDVIDAVEFVGLGPKIRHEVGTLGAAERRLVEVARAVVGKPRLVLLDEPGAGLPDEETAVLGNIIRQIPERTGAMVVLVDHDMELVSATCGQVAVLDFGRVIANGPDPRGAGRSPRDPGLSRRRRERAGVNRASTNRPGPNRAARMTQLTTT